MMSLKKIYAIYMIVIGILGQAVYLAQAYKIFTTKSAHDLSMFGFVFGLIGVFSWFIYGIVLKNTPLIIANLVATLAALLVVIGIIIYG